MKINNINIKKLKNIDKKRICKIISSLLLVTSLTSCFNEKEEPKRTKAKDSYNTERNIQTETIIDTYETIKDAEETINEYIYNDFTNNIESNKVNGILNKKIVLNDDFVNEFQSTIQNIDTYYPNSELFGIEKALKQYNNLKDYTSNYNNIFSNNEITSSQLLNIIKINNSKENYKEYEQINDSDLSKISDILSKVINKYLSDNQNMDLKLLSEKISNLKVKNYPEFSNGSYDPNTGVMCFSIERLKSDNDFFNNTVEHECFHLLQSNSYNETLNTNIEYRFGPCYKFNNLNIQPLYWNWYYEGAAEYLTMDYNDIRKSNVYEYQIKMFDSIKVSTIVDSSKDLYDFESISLNSNLNEIFKYFDCNSDLEKEEIIKMFYSIDFILKSPEAYKAFDTAYRDINKTSMDAKTERLFMDELKGSIGLTLTKQFYKSLMKEYHNKEVSIKDIFTLSCIFENEMSRLTWYNSTSSKEQLYYFVSNYINIQNSFFEQISELSNISIDDLFNSFDYYSNYYMEAEDLNIFNKEKKEYLNYILQTRQNDKTNSIYQSYERQYKKEKGAIK